MAEPWRVRFSRQDATRYDYWRRMEFTPAQWRGLAEHARECGLWFLSSPFSVEAVELLEEVGVPAWKVGAGAGCPGGGQGCTDRCNGQALRRPEPLNPPTSGRNRLPPA